MNIKQLKEVIEKLFTERQTFMILCQEIADNFYPERADFTVRKTHGSEFAADLMTSYPQLTRRDLGDQIGTMLRPTDKEWFKMAPEDKDRENNEAKRWLERTANAQRRAMYDRRALFTRATKEGDHDFASFGQCVISVRLNKNADSLLYRNWHIRDVAWKENEEGKIGLIARKWKPYARDLVALFKNVDDKVTRTASKQPFTKINCFHIICDEDMYDEDSQGRPYWSIFYDNENDKVMEAVPVWNQEYVIPRWQTVSGSQYAFSPATITALPDARLIQSMTYALLEAGEKAVNPPMIATQDVVRSDVSIYARGITWVSEEYDERMGDALRPIPQDLRGLPFGDNMAMDSRELINQAFYLNKLTLPERAPEMTAYEVGQRIQEYIRGALPIFEPMEMEYNGGLCEMSFDVLMRAGAFGSVHDVPPSLQGQDVQFKFESPLHDAIEQQKGQKFLEGKALLAEAVDIDPSARFMIDTSTALRDALAGVGVPSEWINSKITVEEMVAQERQQEQAVATLETMQQGADVAATVGEAKKALA